MADNLRLRVVLDLAERVLAPMKRISSSSSDAARALKAAKDRLKELNAQQAQVGEFRTLKTNLQETAAKLTEAQAKVGTLARAFGQAGPPTRAMERALASAKREAAALGVQHTQQQEKLQQLRTRLSAAGISTRELGTQSQRLRSDIAATNAAITEQTAKLRANAEQQKQLAKLRDQHAKSMVHTGMAAAGSAALMAGGNKLAGPLRSVVGAFVPAENSETQLRASMMTNTGAVGPEYKQILDLATRLGDRLPGTTADFIDMMTMLRRQGMSAQTILGGMGESAAYLGIQLRMPVTAAAEFAAKMQDATQTTEGDLMGLMDLIQRSFYLGVDPTNMLQGFTKVGAVMPYLGKKGLEASNMLAPMLVMFDQAGMKGEEAGNALRKVVNMSMNEGKLSKANGMLKGTGIQLEFFDKKGHFAGFDNLFAQLDKLKTIDSHVKRSAVMEKLFGDDAQTFQVLNTLMEKGKAGYDETVAKLQAQADLRMRVNEQLKTVSASVEAAQGSFTNMLKDMGATIAPDLVLILNKLGALANSIGTWARENQNVVKWGLRVVGVLSALAIGAGALGLALASVLGPMMISRFLLARLVLSLGATRTAAATAAQSTGLLARMWTALGSALTKVGPWLVRMGPWLAGASKGAWAWGAKLATAVPVVLRFALALMRLVPVWGWLATAAMMWFQNWEGIKGGWFLLWEDLSQSASNSIRGLVQGLGWVKDQFFAIGGNLMEGMAAGIAAGVGAVANAINGVAESTMAWFREKLGIASPSKVFMQYGGWISEGAALGIQGGQGAVRTAALAMATAATTALPMAAGAAALGPDGQPPLQAQALRLDTRPPLMAAATGPGVGGGSGGSTYNITINAAPGMDPKELVRLISAEMDRRERSQKSRVLSSMSDID